MALSGKGRATGGVTIRDFVEEGPGVKMQSRALRPAARSSAAFSV